MGIFGIKKYGIIQRSDPHAGLFSFFNTAVGGIGYCDEKDIIPIVDMRTGDNIYKKTAEDNSWENFFKQPALVGLSNMPKLALREKIDCISLSNRPNMKMEFLSDQKQIDYWREIVKKYIALSDEAKKYCDTFEKMYLCKEMQSETVGVLIRGTDYTGLRPKGHPIQPSVAEVCEIIDTYLGKMGMKNIYLVTEDEEIANQVKERYGDRAIIPRVKRYGTECHGFLAAAYKEDLLSQSYEYLASIVLLSKCKCMIAGRTSGSVAAFLMAEELEKVYFFDKGLY